MLLLLVRNRHLNQLDMNKQLKDKIKGVLIVPLGISLVLVPLSMLIGWDLLTLVIFWFIITVGLAIYLPTIVSENENHMFESITGLLIFYAIMVFMIYDHYMTDYFKIMMISCFTNVILVLAFAWARNGKAQLR